MRHSALPIAALTMLSACTPMLSSPHGDSDAPIEVAAFAATAPTPVPYNRDLYRHWVDADGDCQDTRQEVLIAESLVEVTLDEAGCRVIAGRWLDPYSGQTFTDPSALDIDHVIPLAEAHRSGADVWTAEQRRAFANDLDAPDSLIAVSASENRAKGDRDPVNWMPSNNSFHCEYAAIWLEAKERWGLIADPAEVEAINHVLEGCE